MQSPRPAAVLIPHEGPPGCHVSAGRCSSWIAFQATDYLTRGVSLVSSRHERSCVMGVLTSGMHGADRIQVLYPTSFTPISSKLISPAVAGLEQICIGQICWARTSLERISKARTSAKLTFGGQSWVLPCLATLI